MTAILRISACWKRKANTGRRLPVRPAMTNGKAGNEGCHARPDRASYTELKTKI